MIAAESWGNLNLNRFTPERILYVEEFLVLCKGRNVRLKGAIITLLLVEKKLVKLYTIKGVVFRLRLDKTNQPFFFFWKYA